MVRRGEVRVNGSRARVGYRVQRGDKVRVPPYRVDPEPEEPTTGPSRRVYAALLESAVYQDDDVIVLDKPSGLAVHGGSGIAFGVVETLRGFEPRASYELVHRIDRDTSGCLVLAKNRRTLLALHAQFREGVVRKRYDLVVAGRWPAGTRAVDSPLARYALRTANAAFGSAPMANRRAPTSPSRVGWTRARGSPPIRRRGEHTRFGCMRRRRATPYSATTSTRLARPAPIRA